MRFGNLKLETHDSISLQPDVETYAFSGQMTHRTFSGQKENELNEKESVKKRINIVN